MKTVNLRAIILSVLFVLFVLWGICFVPFLPARLTVIRSDGKLLGAYPVTAMEFDVQFCHSVNKGLVIEEYALNTADNTLALKTGLFESYGAGMLDIVPENASMTQTNDFVRIDYDPQFYPWVVYLPGGNANHIFTYGDNRINLVETSLKQSVTIELRRVSVVSLIAKRIKKR